MKVFIVDQSGWQYVGDADVDGQDREFVVTLFGGASMIEESFLIWTVAEPDTDRHLALGDRIVLAQLGQMVELLPAWRPLAPS